MINSRCFRSFIITIDNDTAPLTQSFTETPGCTKTGSFQNPVECFSLFLLMRYDRQLAIDESVISFKGRVGFLQYLKGKRNPWGIKAFVLADSVTGYLYKVRFYFGKDTQLERPELPHTARVLLTLVNGLHHKGYYLYVDHFYSSPLVAIELKKVGITLTGKVHYN